MTRELDYYKLPIDMENDKIVNNLVSIYEPILDSIRKKSSSQNEFKVNLEETGVLDNIYRDMDIYFTYPNAVLLYDNINSVIDAYSYVADNLPPLVEEKFGIIFDYLFSEETRWLTFLEGTKQLTYTFMDVDERKRFVDYLKSAAAEDTLQVILDRYFEGIFDKSSGRIKDFSSEENRKKVVFGMFINTMSAIHFMRSAAYIYVYLRDAVAITEAHPELSVEEVFNRANELANKFPMKEVYPALFKSME